MKSPWILEIMDEFGNLAPCFVFSCNNKAFEFATADALGYHGAKVYAKVCWKYIY